jgi:hypothetical protein
MTRMRVFLLVLATVVLTMAFDHAIGQKAMAQEVVKTSDKDLEKVLEDADMQWLCNFPNSPHFKPGQACVDFRNKYWADQFFEISNKGLIRTKAQMVAEQSRPNYVKVIPYTNEFKLMGVYGNFAVATDHTLLKTSDANGKPVEIETRVLRMFAKEGGTWRPAGAALVPILSK